MGNMVKHKKKEREKDKRFHRMGYGTDRFWERSIYCGAPYHNRYMLSSLNLITNFLPLQSDPQPHRHRGHQYQD